MDEKLSIAAAELVVTSSLYRFPKSARLLKRRDFQRFGRRSGKARVGVYLIVDMAPNSLGRGRLGITASRQFGDAVARNRAKRRIREAFRQLRSRLPISYDIHVRPRREILKGDASEIQNELLRLATIFHQRYA